MMGFKQELIRKALRGLFRVTQGEWPEQKIQRFEVDFEPDGTYHARVAIEQPEQAQIAGLAVSFFRASQSVNQVTFQFLDGVGCEVYEVCIQKLSRPGMGKINYAMRKALEAIAQECDQPVRVAQKALDACGYTEYAIKLNKPQ